MGVVEILNHALASRGMAPMQVPWRCPCCGDALDPDEQGDPEFFSHSLELVERYGSMPCMACADEHETCAQCGKAVKDSDPDFRRNEGGDQEPFCDGNCEAEWWRDARVGWP